MTVQQLFPATDVRFEHHPDGFVIDTDRPRLSWRVSPKPDSDIKNWSQKGYAVEVWRSTDGCLYSSEGTTKTYHVASASSILNAWPSWPLQSREVAKVRVVALNHDHTRSGNPVSLSGAEWAVVEAGLLHASDWKAKLVTAPAPPPPEHVPHRPVLYRKTFSYEPREHDTAARLYITSLGLYEVFINGKRVGDHHMAPGWTSYHYRLQYQAYDVKDLLVSGKNSISVEVAEGWYAGRLLWIPEHRNVYGDRPGFLAQLEIHGYDMEAKDGNETRMPRMQRVISDESWLCHPSPRQSASIYDGETYDAREEVSGWNTTDFEASSAWKKATTLAFSYEKVKLFAPDVPPVRETRVVKPIKVFKSPSGKTLVDFGQNLVGRITFKGLRKPKGHVITIRHAEVLERGELGTRPLRNAKATDRYIFSGNEGGKSEWNPHFTFHGFRYVEFEGWSPDDDTPPSADNLFATVLHTDMKRTGYFKCSNDMVNKLHENVLWSMRGNFLSVPTDCPQRDERLGWTGDIQVFAPTASFLYSSSGFLANWLKDLAIDQEAANGCVPIVIPNVLTGHSNENSNPVAVWDDAAILVPWTVYNWSGDVEVLRRQWHSMEMHIHKSIRRGADGLWDASLFQFGDWLDPNAPPDQADLARTDGTLVADLYLVYVTGVMSEIAVAIGNAAAARSYQEEYERVKKTFSDKYVTNAGLVVGDSQTALALAICFSLLGTDVNKLAVAGDRLARLVRQAHNRVSTGFAGTPLVLHALTQTGHTDLAYDMLLEQSCPSWLYPVTMGATTIWERWDSMLPDGSINSGEMTSFNHYALGSVANWLHAVVGGISPLEPGWKTFKVQPRPGGGLTSCETRFESPVGWVAVSWSEVPNTNGKRYWVRVEVPANASALVVLAGREEEWKGSGKWEWEWKLAA